MNPLLEYPLPGGPLAPGQLSDGWPRSQRHAPTKGLTWTGIAAFTVGVMVALSAYQDFRLPMGDLLVHIYLLPLVILFAFVLFARMAAFPRAPLLAFVAFTSLMCLATLSGPGALSEIVKIASGTVTVITVALLIRTDRDFRVAALGLLGAVAYMSIHGLITKHDSFAGTKPLEGANENAFSLYALPPVLLAGYIFMDRSASKIVRWVAVSAGMVIVLAMFSNANRSGWLGVALIAVMLLWSGQFFRSAFFVAILVGAAYLLINNYGDLALLRFRFNETFTEHNTDRERITMFLACLEIGLKNPVLGVSPQNVNMEMTRALGFRFLTDPHNVYGYIVGGAGLFTAAVFAYLAWSLFRKPSQPVLAGGRRAAKKVIAPHRLLQMMLVLWAVRGFFSREIIYSPGFCMGLGLVIGLCIAQGVWARTERGGALHPGMMMPQMLAH